MREKSGHYILKHSRHIKIKSFLQKSNIRMKITRLISGGANSLEK